MDYRGEAKAKSITQMGTLWRENMVLDFWRVGTAPTTMNFSRAYGDNKQEGILSG